MITATGNIFYIQMTTWRDKKQVCFLSSNKTGSSEEADILVTRGTKGKKEKDIITGTMAQQDYAKNYAAVDRNDRDSADYSTTIQTYRFYLHIFCWMLDRVVHLIFVVIYYEVMAPQLQLKMLAAWKVFANQKNFGQKDSRYS